MAYSFLCHWKSFIFSQVSPMQTLEIMARRNFMSPWVNLINILKQRKENCTLDDGFDPLNVALDETQFYQIISLAEQVNMMVSL